MKDKNWLTVHEDHTVSIKIERLTLTHDILKEWTEILQKILKNNERREKNETTA